MPLTADDSLPLQKETMNRLKKHWIKGAVKHEGAVTDAAKRKGIPTREEADRESKSPDKRIGARGRLAKRFISGDLS